MNYLRKIFLALIILMLGLSILGCSSEPQQDISQPEDPQTEETVVEIEVPKEKKEGTPSPLSGLYFPNEKLQRRPLAIIYDNHGQARPQAGLIDAEIAFEFLAEGDITRYLGIFLGNEPEAIGGIRSARSYFIEKALELDAIFVHVGGSPEAFRDLSKYKVNSINAMNRGNDVFWRKNHKVAPHNMYSSHKAIRGAAKNSSFREEASLEAWSFYEETQEINGEAVNEIEIFYSKPYNPSYRFNKEEMVYYRYYNGKPHIDETTKQQLYATNIIIQAVNARVVDKELRLDMDTIGEGKGLYISNGKAIDIVWKKKDYKGLTRFYDLDGNEITFNPGKTWVQVVKSLDSVTIL
ncbi:DUF3048 domain-containing protein [Alkaliphilus pronyensis]|uniref:DUF3048 domain-containing protein n=1 Tax=Alkaliphilus pronyensis TaxID=1482732 RepID=A0A6I0F0C8_9FIRM|nr:DUF3048 domain-containing protein [Alkaliphilus pronyensis]KAB3535357.1 DUF3048 domain-containing protein [Alkaliphilus pronyensis]